MNEVYEANFPEGKQKLKPDASHDERTAYIRAKYIEKLFTSVHTQECSDSFFRACKKDDLKSMLFYFAHGVDIDARYPPRNEFVLFF